MHWPQYVILTYIALCALFAGCNHKRTIEYTIDFPFRVFWYAFSVWVLYKGHFFG